MGQAFAYTGAAHAYYNPGTPTGYVSDYGDLLTAETEAAIEGFLAEFEETDSTQIAVVTIPSMEGDYIEHFAVRLFSEWGIGRADVDNGALLLIAVEDRELRIEVGYGLEGHLTNAESGAIIRNILTPAFKEGAFEQGVIDAVVAMVDASRGAYEAPVGSYEGDVRFSFWSNIAIVFFVWFFGFIVPMIGAAALTEKTWPGAVFGAFMGYFMFIMLGVLWEIPFFVYILGGGFVGWGIDYFVSRAKILDKWRKKLHSTKKSGGRSFWFGGRGGGSGGGGGFGGFGGGMSGGGGASGGW